jgi:hypothetical protein
VLEAAGAAEAGREGPSTTAGTGRTARATVGAVVAHLGTKAPDAVIEVAATAGVGLNDAGLVQPPAQSARVQVGQGGSASAAAAAAYAPPVAETPAGDNFQQEQQQLIRGMFTVGGLATVRCLDPARKGTQLQLQVTGLVGQGGQAAAWLMAPNALAPGAAAAAGASAAVPGGRDPHSSSASLPSNQVSSLASAPTQVALAPATAPAMNPPKPLPERLVLKVALPEAALAPSKRRKFGPGQWKRSSLLTCLQEFDALNAHAKMPWVLDSYGWGMVQLASGEEMPCLLLEYAPWGTLEDQLVGEDGQPQGLAPEVCRMVVDYVVQCLLPRESRGVYIHRDIKPANIMLCNPPAGWKASPLAPWVPKLGDWGISRHISIYRWLSTTVACTPAYQAPEMRLGAFHDTRVDTWCVGCLLVHIRSGKLPFLYLWEDPGVAEDERRLRRSGGCSCHVCCPWPASQCS